MRIGSPSTYLEVGAICDQFSSARVKEEQFERVGVQVFQIEFAVAATTQVGIELSAGGNLFGKSFRTAIVGQKLGTHGSTVIGPDSFFSVLPGE